MSFIQLRDKVIKSILEKACGLSNEPVRYAFTHVYVRCKTMPTNVFLQLSKNVENQMGRDLGIREDVEDIVYRLSVTRP